MLLIPLILIAALVISLIAAISAPQRINLWGWIFPVSVVSSLVLGILIGLLLCVIASTAHLLPPCQGMFCDLAQYIYIIIGAMIVTLIVSVALLAGFGKKIKVMAKERRVLWVINSAVLALPLLITLFFMSGIGNILFS